MDREPERAREMIKRRRDVMIGTILLLFWAALPIPSDAGTVFYDDFNGPTLNPAYQAILPDAPWRYSASPFNATYLGASNYSFTSVGGSSVIELNNTLNNQERVGWSTSTVFSTGAPILYEARFNTLVQSATTGIDELLELWLLDPKNINRYDEVGLLAPGYGTEHFFTAMSSISGSGTDAIFSFANNTWYRMMITGSTTQDIQASIYADDGTTQLISINLGHTLSSYSSGFEIGFSQSMGRPNSPYPTSVAIDNLELISTVPEPHSVMLLCAGAVCMLGYGWRDGKTGARIW
jgi:hypothetical protein